MGFGNNVIRPFTRQAIEALTPNQVGVYGIFKQDEWIYVGSGDIRTRLLAHLNGDNSLITVRKPTSWLAEVTSNYVQREKELILELRPTCNQKVG